MLDPASLPPPETVAPTAIPAAGPAFDQYHGTSYHGPSTGWSAAPPASLPAVGRVGTFTLGAVHVGLIQGAAERLGIGAGHPKEGETYPAIVTAVNQGIPASAPSSVNPAGDPGVPASVTVEVFGLAERLVTQAVPDSTEAGGFSLG